MPFLVLLLISAIVAAIAVRIARPSRELPAVILLVADIAFIGCMVLFGGVS